MPPGSTTNRLGSTLLRTTRVPGTLGVSWIAASVASAAMLVEKLTEVGASTGPWVAPLCGSVPPEHRPLPRRDLPVVVAGFPDPVGVVVAPASVNVYVVLG